MTAPIRTVIADDEVLARRTLRELLAQVPEVVVVGECRDGREVVTALRDLAPELLFLDIQMPGLDGFGALAEGAAASRPVTVFVTAHEHHAVRAFDVDAIDYLLKPFDDERFARALRRARDQVTQRRIAALAAGLAPPPAEAPAPARGDGRLAVRDGHALELVDSDAVDWIAAEGYYCELHIGARELLVREPLHELEARLDPARFVRIHRSTIVNVQRIRRVIRMPRGELEVVLIDGRRLRASRSRRKALEALLQR